MLYRQILDFVPAWIDWLIKKTGYGYYLLEVLGVEIFSFRNGDDYIIKIRKKGKGCFSARGGIYV